MRKMQSNPSDDSENIPDIYNRVPRLVKLSPEFYQLPDKFRPLPRNAEYVQRLEKLTSSSPMSGVGAFQVYFIESIGFSNTKQVHQTFRSLFYYTGVKIWLYNSPSADDDNYEVFYIGYQPHSRYLISDISQEYLGEVCTQNLVPCDMKILDNEGGEHLYHQLLVMMINGPHPYTGQLDRKYSARTLQQLRCLIYYNYIEEPVEEVIQDLYQIGASMEWSHIRETALTEMLSGWTTEDLLKALDRNIFHEYDRPLIVALRH